MSRTAGSSRATTSLIRSSDRSSRPLVADTTIVFDVTCGAAYSRTARIPCEGTATTTTRTPSTASRIDPIGITVGGNGNPGR
jgi:hypothetical protein